MVEESEPTVLGRNNLRIELEGGNARIKVTDSNGDGGGNVRTCGGQPIRWTNRTGHVCRLSFREFLAADDEEIPKPTWPFRGDPPCTPNEVIIGDDDFFQRSLRKGGIEGLVKYDVVVELGGGSSLVLDPIIIIDK